MHGSAHQKKEKEKTGSCCIARLVFRKWQHFGHSFHGSSMHVRYIFFK